MIILILIPIPIPIAAATAIAMAIVIVITIIIINHYYYHYKCYCYCYCSYLPEDLAFHYMPSHHPAHPDPHTFSIILSLLLIHVYSWTDGRGRAVGEALKH